MKILHVDFWASHWLEGAIVLSHVERSVYITICAGIYAVGGPVELSHVRKFCPGHGFKKGLDGLVEKGKITIDGSKADCERCEIELSRARKRTEQAQQNGAKGGRPNGLEKPGGYNARATLPPDTRKKLGDSNILSLIPENQNLSETFVRSSTNSVGSLGEPEAPTAPLIPGDRFDEFWTAYPSRAPHANPRAKARAKFDRLVRDGIDPQILIDAAKAYAELQRVSGKQPEFNAMTITWLNQERWKVEPPASARERDPDPAREKYLAQLDIELADDGGDPDFVNYILEKIEWVERVRAYQNNPTDPYVWDVNNWGTPPGQVPANGPIWHDICHCPRDILQECGFDIVYREYNPYELGYVAWRWDRDHPDVLAWYKAKFTSDELKEFEHWSQYFAPDWVTDPGYYDRPPCAEIHFAPGASACNPLAKTPLAQLIGHKPPPEIEEQYKKILGLKEYRRLVDADAA